MYHKGEPKWPSYENTALVCVTSIDGLSFIFFIQELYVPEIEHSHSHDVVDAAH